MSKINSLLLCLLTISLISCSSSDKTEELKVAEIPTTENDFAEGAEVDLLESGKKLFQSQIYGASRDIFDSLAKTYPDSPYVEYAEIKAADADFELREYLTAAQRYEEIITARPGSASLPYVMVRAGRSLQLSSKGAGRDQTPLRRAVELFDTVRKDYPDSAYAAIASKHRMEVMQTIAESEQEIIAYYEASGHPKAAEARRAAYEKNWAAAASAEIPENPVQVPAPVLAKKVAPQEDFLTTAVVDQVPDVRASQSREPLESKRTDIQHVDCSTSGKTPLMVLYLNVPASDLKVETAAQGNQLKISVAGLTTREASYSCFGPNDLQVDASGKITLESTQNFSEPKVMTIANPERIIISLTPQ